MSKSLFVTAVSLALCGGVHAQAQASTQTKATASNDTSIKASKSGAQAQSQTSASSDTKVQAEKNKQGAKASGSNESSAKAQAGSSSVDLSSGSTMEAVLTKPVDSNKAKPGDPVEAKVAKDVKSESDGKVIIPKGTKLLGHVTEARPRSKDSKDAKAEAKGESDSRLGIDFDKAIFKDGREAPLNVAIQAVAAAESMTQASAAGDDLMATSNAAGSAAGSTRPASGGASGGGGLVGGVASTVGATAGAATGAAGGVGQTVGGTVGSATSATGNVGAGNLTGALNSNSGGVIGLQGLNLITETAGSAQGSVITSGERNVKLESGTRMLLKVVQQEPAATPKQ